MALSAGERVGHHEILAPIGAGGMGEVYRARDTRLKRDVALKVLPAAFSSDASRMMRFQREAELLASLNHPNIAQIYGVEERALAMELVEGESPRGPLPFDEAWKIALQIADALEYAHGRGIVHRDLKPANVIVTPDGVVKLLDFGLAKALHGTPEAPSGDPENSPTVTLGATVAGTILGTAAYMSPEQARGKPADNRADIWAWGVVLWELLTGERLFRGEDAAETLAAVIHKQPDLDRVPPQVRKLLRRCLEKDPKRRLKDIGEARWLLEEAASGAPVAAPPRPWLLIAGLAASILALGALGYIHFRDALAPRAPQRLTIVTPAGTTNIHSFSISPDGKYLAMALRVNGKLQLWLRPLDELELKAMSGTDDAAYPFWSPDSRSIGFFAQRKLKKIAAGGGPAVALCDAPDPRGGSWNRDGVIVFSPSAGGAIQRVPADGGAPTDVTPTKGLYKHPVFLPDGKHLLYLVAQTSPEKNGIHLTSLEGKEDRRILPDESAVTFAAGRLLFIRENTLMAQNFDPDNGATAGDAYPIAAGVSLTSNINYAPVTVSESGILLYESVAAAQVTQLGWFDRSGKLLAPIGELGPNSGPSISPDGKSVLFSRSTASGGDIMRRDLLRGGEQRLTTDPSTNGFAVWSPHGDRLVFSSNRKTGIFNLYEKGANGGPDELLFESPNAKYASQWSADGRLLLYSEADPKTKLDMWVLPIDTAGKPGKPTPFLRTEFNESQPQLSPDGHWIAYASDKFGQAQVYAAAFPSGEGEMQISTMGGEQPRWSVDGKELFFIGGGGNMMAAPMKATAGPRMSLEPGAPQPLFDVRLRRNPLHPRYDVTADGKRFLIETEVDQGAPALTVVLNWDSALKK